ncbi:MAG: Flp pilus assembly complex ATPase component TadA [Candidatus Omnitrophica bacterium]|nr:Flp pilus assembly complex ATPase component TadA [Candidatus Omnitrophota bacterium]
MTEERDNIGKYLVKKGIITEEQLVAALKRQKNTSQRLGSILIEQEFATQRQVIEALAQQFNLECVNLDEGSVDTSLVSIFFPEKMREWKIVPVKLKDDTLTVAITDPLDINMLQRLKYLSGYKIVPVLATPEEIETCINKCFGPLQHMEDALHEIVTEKRGDTGEKEMSLQDLQVAVKEAPVVKLVNSIISEAIKSESSDIHFEPQRERVRVRYRIDGLLYEKFTVPKGLQPPVTSRIKIMAGMDIAERRRPQDGRIGLMIGDREYDIRVSTLPDIYGEKVVLRILDKKSIRIHLGSLGLDEQERDIVEKLISYPYGIILVTGPTGSGKTTTLYSVLNKLNDTTRNIVTVEDPIEYELEGVNQTAVNVRANYTFATGMRHILRQDPDIVMIGEIRDVETAEIAIQAALTGHLVFSTLHTNNAPSAIIRLLNMNIEPFLISSSVIAVIAQRLVRKVCDHCAEEIAIPGDIKKDIADLLPNIAEAKCVKGKGCDHCNGIGYRGRTAIYEIMPITQEIRDLVLRRATEQEISDVALAQGMRTLQASGLKKVLEKNTTIEEVMRVAFVKRI